MADKDFVGDAMRDDAVADAYHRIEEQTKEVDRLQKELLSANTKLAKLQEELKEGFGLYDDEEESPDFPEIRLDSAEEFVVKTVVEQLAPVRDDWFRDRGTLHLVTIMDMVLKRINGEATYPEDLLNLTAVGVEYVKALKSVFLSLTAPDIANDPASVSKLVDRVDRRARGTLPKDASPLVLSFLSLLSAALIRERE